MLKSNCPKWMKKNQSVTKIPPVNLFHSDAGQRLLIYSAHIPALPPVDLFSGLFFPSLTGVLTNKFKKLHTSTYRLVYTQQSWENLEARLRNTRWFSRNTLTFSMLYSDFWVKFQNNPAYNIITSCRLCFCLNYYVIYISKFTDMYLPRHKQQC